MKTILVTGANGFLGQHLTLFLQKRPFKVIATGRGACRIGGITDVEYFAAELTNKKTVETLLSQYKPDVIIHTAALSKPDECENNKEDCLNNNVEATNNLIKGNDSHFIYISTDFVFGENGPNAENDATGPVNFYGETKLMAEQLVRESGIKNTIVRPAFIYGKAQEGMRPTFLHWVKNNLEQQKRIKVVSDQLRTPTYVIDICSGIETIINQGLMGVFNLAGKDVLSPYQMAIKTAMVLDLDTSLIEKVTAETFPEPVKRAKRSGLKIDKAQRELNYTPVSFEEGVRLTFAR
jgi:dTDP-4-dehydrorhamnose reductase